MRRGDGGDDGRGENSGRVRNVAMLFHVGELVAEGGNVNVGERGGEAFHEGMLHAGASPVSEDKKLTSGGRNKGERGDVAGIGDWEVEEFSGRHGDGILAERKRIRSRKTTPHTQNRRNEAPIGGLSETIRNLTGSPTWFAA